MSILDYPLGGVELVRGGTDLDLLLSELVVPCSWVLRFARLVLLMVVEVLVVVIVVVVNGSILGQVNLRVMEVSLTPSSVLFVINCPLRDQLVGGADSGAEWVEHEHILLVVPRGFVVGVVLHAY